MHYSTEPLLEVGIVSGINLTFNLKEQYFLVGYENSQKTYYGKRNVSFKEGKIFFEERKYDDLEFRPLTTKDSCFELYNVKIGIDFHWERTEKQAFEGYLKIIVKGNRLTAINRVPLESYLTSVISSEMSAKASEELLKAHAVISRSWILSQLQQKGKNIQKNPGFIESETERIKWYDREDHINFDVCADDHCQRYQGKTRASTEQVINAIEATRGKVLCLGDEICDTRFSKCCGGILEEFQNCWEDIPKSYLRGIADNDHSSSEVFTNGKENEIPDLRIEENAESWIIGNPSSFCNTKKKKILEQVLNNYDQETTDFFRWKISFGKEELSHLVKQKSGIDFGEIIDLVPLKRGASGRIVKLKIVGSKKTMTIGKELEIRKTLSPTHLYSSAFVVKKNNRGFILHGAGWGHGVGLCQIGAAMMGEKGYRYQDILRHYYPDTKLDTLYV